MRNLSRPWRDTGIAPAALALALALGSVATTAHGQVQATDADWSMVAATPERSSWVSEEVRGDLSPEWYLPLPFYVGMRIQVIAVQGVLYVSTAGGLFAVTASDGDVRWIYPTGIPLGNSPTYHEGTLYVGSYDHTIHAVDAETGLAKEGWERTAAKAGFEANPLVIPIESGARALVLAGNRDGTFYAFDAATGGLEWRHETGGPILSAAYHDNTIYFASNDLYAYALDVATGDLVWRSGPFTSVSGFYSYWPVVYAPETGAADVVILAGATPYRTSEGFNFPILEGHDLFRDPDNPEVIENGTLLGTEGEESGPWPAGTITVDASRAFEYLETHPHRRTVLALDRATGAEITTDVDGDDRPEYAPFTYNGAESGSRFPGLVSGLDDIYYQFTMLYSTDWIMRGNVVGWGFAGRFVSSVGGRSSGYACDEPMVFSSGGRVLYYALCCDRSGGAQDVTVPRTQRGQHWSYWDYSLWNQIPNYQARYYGNDRNGWGLYGGINGVYGRHGNAQGPLVPHEGRVYTVKGNSLIAFGPEGGARELPEPAVPEPPESVLSIDTDWLEERLAAEVQAILDAGHLKPGYLGTGLFDIYARDYFDRWTDYFHSPADTIVTLVQALPLLSPDLQEQVRTYLSEENAAYPVDSIAHIGFAQGQSRTDTSIPPEAVERLDSEPSETVERPGVWWTSFSPYSFYGAWKYATVFDNAAELYGSMAPRLEEPPEDAVLVQMPYIANAYIAGYWGFLELESLAGEPASEDKQAILDHLLEVRVSGFSADAPWVVEDTPDQGFTHLREYQRAMNAARNFLYLTPELAGFLRENIAQNVRQAVDAQEEAGPYWFVNKYDSTAGEGTIHYLHDSFALFQARARILGQAREEIFRYLDAPAFPRGDLYYIQNLVALLQAPLDPDVIPPPDPPDPDDDADASPGDGAGGDGGDEGGSGDEGCRCGTPGAPGSPLAAAALLALVVVARRRFWRGGRYAEKTDCDSSRHHTGPSSGPRGSKP